MPRRHCHKASRDPGKAKATGSTGDPICLGMGRSGDCRGARRAHKRERLSHIALDAGCFAVAFDADHPIGRELIITADLTAAENSVGTSGNGTEGNTRQLRYSRRVTEISDRDGLASPAIAEV